MVNSRDISLLRGDVKANVDILLQLCETEGLPVLITQTMRDDAYQSYLYEQGRTRPGKIVTNSRRTTFHGAGLAFDFCKNVKGQEYSDPVFFDRVIALAKQVGFSSGADWKKFPEQCHLQWDERGKYRFDREKGPKKMPLYEEDEMITATSVEQMDDTAVLALANRMQTVLGRQTQSGKVGGELREAVELGITDGSEPRKFCTRAQAAVMVKRAMKGE